jgi:hypothetical protein
MDIKDLMPYLEEDTGTQISSVDGLHSFLDSLDSSGTEPTVSEDTQVTDEGTTEEPAATEGTAQQSTQTETKPQTQKPLNQQNYAFAQMRQQNSQLTNLLGKVAKAAGIQYTDNNDLMNKLNDDALGKLAQSQNVPVEILKKIEQFEANEQLRQAEKLQADAFLGFQQVKDQFSLTDEELRNFAKELDEKNMNPFQQRVNLASAYRELHFDEIVEKRAKAAVEEALKRSNAADKHSTTPSSTQGKPDAGNPEKITTVDGLHKFLDGLK